MGIPEPLRRGAVLPLSLLCLGVLAGCDRRQSSTAEADPAGADPVIPVAIHVLETGRVAASVRAWGTVLPWRSAEIHAELTGRVASVQAGLGDAVRRGDVILEIDPDLYAARAREAESGYKSAQTANERAAKELARREALFAKGTVSDSELETARTEAASAEAALARAAAALEQAQKHLAEARLRAPFDGVLANRPPDLGSTVSPGTLLATLVDVSRLRVDAQLSEQDLSRIRLGDAVSLNVAGAPGRTFEGKVVSVGPEADATTRQFPVEIEVENPPDRPLRGGMVARIEIVVEEREDLPLLPVDALVEREGELYFYAVRDGRAERIALAPGPREGQVVGILEGAAPGDTVVVQGQVRLAPGVRVQVDEVR